MKYDNPIRVFLGLLCLAGFVALLWAQKDRALSGENDFIPFYVGGLQAGDGDLYQPDPYYRFQEEQFGKFGESLIYIRLPFYALLLKPLTWLGSYERAYAAYVLLRLLTIAGFLWLWPKSGRWDAAMFTLMSLPLFIGMMTGQDVVLLLPLLAWALRAEKQGKDFQAGLALSLCAIKPHLLLLAPAALVAQRRWGVLKGGIAGGAALFFLSFAAGGAGWISSLLNVLRRNAVHPSADSMPNLNGLLDGVPHAQLWMSAGALLSLAAVVLVARRGSFAAGLAAATMASLLATGHAYVADLVVLLPGLLAITQEAAPLPASRFLAFVWLGPVLPLLLLIGRPASYAPQIALPLTLAILAIAGATGVARLAQAKT